MGPLSFTRDKTPWNRTSLHLQSGHNARPLSSEMANMTTHVGKPATTPSGAKQGPDSPMAARDLLNGVYADLRRTAQIQLARLGPGQTLQATALVHEAWLHVAGKRDPGWDSRAHFFGAAARAMREILIQQHRRKTALKRGGEFTRQELPDVSSDSHGLDQGDLLGLVEVLDRLEAKDPDKAEIVMLRFFAGLTMIEVAEVLELPLTRVERDWRFARSWLQLHMQDPQ